MRNFTRVLDAEIRADMSERKALADRRAAEAKAAAYPQRKMEEIKAERDLAILTLKLGGHLRPNGSICHYVGGLVCNKCGHVDEALMRVTTEAAELRAEVETLHEALEALGRRKAP